MAVAVAIDESETQDDPIQATVAKFLLGDDLAGRVGSGRLGRIAFARWPRQIFVVNEVGTGHDDSCLAGMSPDRRDEVLGAVDVGSPNLLRVWVP